MFERHVLKKLSAYHHGELSREDASRVGAHLLGCPSCRKEYEEIKLGVQLAKCLPRHSAPGSIWNAIERSLDEHEHSSTGRTNYLALGALMRGPKIAVMAAAFLTVLAISGIWYYTRSPRAAWQVARIEGMPKVGSTPVSETGRLAAGEWLETDGISRANIQVGKIGQVEIGRNTRVRLLKALSNEYRLALEHGSMHATIWAPPGLFFVETSSAEAVDLGCAYTLEVDDAGAGLLRVTYGWVAFQRKGRESFVPMGAQCATRPEIGPGTPYFENAPPNFVASLTKLDFEKLDQKAYADELSVVLVEARRQDAFTLWHLLSRVPNAQRDQVYDRLAALVPPPSDVTREGVLKGDKRMLDSWWNALGLGDMNWWRSWKSYWPQ